MIVTPWHGTNTVLTVSHVFNFFKKTPKHQTKPQTKQPTKQTSGTKSCSSSTLFPAFFAMTAAACAQQVCITAILSLPGRLQVQKC